jgi:hypothetical protein
VTVSSDDIELNETILASKIVSNGQELVKIVDEIGFAQESKR